MTPSKNNCPDLTKWREFLDGNLGALTTAELERHLEECDVCAEQADTLCNLGDETLSRMNNYVLHPDERDTVERLIQTAHAMADDYSTHFLVSDGSSADQFEFLSPALEQNEIGRLGKYSIRGVLGSGGMGVVFRAYDAALEREVAVKVIQPKFAESDEAKERFLREAKMTAGIEHDHIVTIYQVDVANDVPFLAMQLLQGESLQMRLLRKKRLTETQAIKITAQIAKGLAVAHDAGLVHRDIKPGNIWLREGDDAVRILDFGLARTDHDVGMTRTGEVVGTPRYMSPEQARGESLDGRSDLFSLGCVLFRMLSGRAPVEKSDMISTLVAVVNDEIDPIESLLPDLDSELALLINELLSIDRESRPIDAQQVVVRLQAVEARLSSEEASTSFIVQAKPEISGDPGRREWTKRWPVLVAAACVLLVFGALTFHFKSHTGNVIVELERPENIGDIRIEGQSLTYQYDGTKQIDVSVPAGSHRLIVESEDGIKLSTSLGETPLELSAGDTVRIRAWLERKTDKAIHAAPLSESISESQSEVRKAASWIVSIGGTCFTSSPYTLVDSMDDLPPDASNIANVNLQGCRDFEPSNLECLLNQELTRIQCLDSSFGDESLVVLSGNNGKAIRQLSQLYAVRSGVSDRGVAELSIATGLKQLFLGMTQFRDCRLLLPFRELYELDLSSCPLLPESLSAIHDLPLTTLDISAEHWSVLAPEPTDRIYGLTTVRIYGVVESTKFDVLSNLTALNSISLSGQNRSAAIPGIWDRIAGLNWTADATLHIDGIALPNGNEEVGDLPEIQHLTLSHLNQSQDVIGLLSKMPNLSSLRLQYATPSDDQIAQLSQFTQLESFDSHGGVKPDPAVVDRLRQQLPDCEISVD